MATTGEWQTVSERSSLKQQQCLVVSLASRMSRKTSLLPSEKRRQNLSSKRLRNRTLKPARLALITTKYLLLQNQFKIPSVMPKKHHKELQQTVYIGKGIVSLVEYNDNWYTIILLIFDPSIKNKYMEDNKTNIQRLIADIAQVQGRLSALKDYKKCAFILGITGSGKSSLISYLCGGHLTFTKRHGRYLLSHNDSRLPQIGNTSQSCTDIPSIYISPNDIVLYDPPGFLQTRGIHQEILNSYCNAKMFKLGNQAKIVILVEKQSLYSARGGAFVEAATRLHRLFHNDFRQIVNSCLLVVTKVLKKAYSDEDIIGSIQQIIHDNKNIHPEAVMLIKTLVDQKRIAIFPTPEDIDPPTINRISENVQKIPAFHVAKEPTIALSAQGKNCIEDLIKHIEKDRSALAELIGQQIKNNFSTLNKSKEELKEKLLSLKSAKKMIIDKEIQNIPQKLDEFKEKLSLKHQSVNKIKQKMSQLEFCQTLYPELDVPSKISEILISDISKVESDVQIVLSKIASKEEMQKMQKDHQQILQNQQKQFQQELLQLEQKHIENQEKLRREAEQRNRAILQQIQSSNQKHASQMKRLNDQLVQLQNQRNKEIQSLKQTINEQNKKYEELKAQKPKVTHVHHHHHHKRKKFLGIF